MLEYKQLKIQLLQPLHLPVQHKNNNISSFLSLPDLAFSVGYSYNIKHNNTDITTIILKTLAMLLPVISGKVVYNNETISYKYLESHSYLRENISYVFKDAIFLSNLSIMENLMLSLNFYYPRKSMLEKKLTIEKFISEHNLANFLNHRPSELSKSLLKLFTILRVFLQNSKFIFFDSPFFLLDYSEAEILNHILKEYQNEKCYIMSNSLPAQVDYNNILIN